MKSKLVAVGLLAGGTALTALTGSAYAAGSAPTAKNAGPVKVTGGAKGPVAVACVGKGVKLKGRPAKVTFSVRGSSEAPALKPGKAVRIVSGREAGNVEAPPAPPAGAKVTKMIPKGGPGTVKFGAPPKGVHCFTVRPGSPPPLPAR